MSEQAELLKTEALRLCREALGADAEAHGLSAEVIVAQVLATESRVADGPLAGPDGRLLHFPVKYDESTDAHVVHHSWTRVDLGALAVAALSVPAVVASKGVLLVCGLAGAALSANLARAKPTPLPYEAGAVFVAIHDACRSRGGRPMPEDDILDPANRLIVVSGRAAIPMRSLRAIVTRLDRDGIVELKDGCVSPVMELVRHHG